MSIFFKKFHLLSIIRLKRPTFNPQWNTIRNHLKPPKNRLLMFPFFQCTLIVTLYRHWINDNKIYKGVSQNLVQFRYLTFLYIWNAFFFINGYISVVFNGLY